MTLRRKSQSEKKRSRWRLQRPNRSRKRRSFEDGDHIGDNDEADVITEGILHHSRQRPKTTFRWAGW
jgi:hypothetical protein